MSETFGIPSMGSVRAELRVTPGGRGGYAGGVEVQAMLLRPSAARRTGSRPTGLVPPPKITLPFTAVVWFPESSGTAYTRSPDGDAASARTRLPKSALTTGGWPRLAIV